jgi:wyosine [tRNA(Phe)-imidazoG37] synthetase (radical SAM superfamily)
MASYHYLFGPVPSRRLGISLGVDLVPHKVCSFNCVYCECGRTTELTQERDEYVHIYRVIDELKEFLKNRPELDHITFSGSGEPLLNKGIAGVLSFIKNNFPSYRTALMTNSSLLVRKEVRSEVLGFDVIVPSLDAVSRDVFNKINRPAPGISSMEIVNALCSLRQEYRGQLWLEIFIVPGVNDTPQEMDLLSKAAERIKPDKIHLNVLDRPGAESWVKPPTPEELNRILGYFRRVKVEVVSPMTPQERRKAMAMGETVDAILALIKRRPCTAEDLALAVSITRDDANRILDALIEEGRIEFKTEERGIFFRPK